MFAETECVGCRVHFPLKAKLHQIIWRDLPVKLQGIAEKESGRRSADQLRHRTVARFYQIMWTSLIVRHSCLTWI